MIKKGYLFLFSSVSQLFTTNSRFEVFRYSVKWCHLLLLKWVDWWQLIALFYVQIMSRDIQNQLLPLILKFRGPSRLLKWIYKTGIALAEKNNNKKKKQKQKTSLITNCKPLNWNFCHVRSLSNVEFLMSAKHLFKSKEIIKEGSWCRRQI